MVKKIQNGSQVNLTKVFVVKRNFIDQSRLLRCRFNQFYSSRPIFIAFKALFQGVGTLVLLKTDNFPVIKQQTLYRDALFVFLVRLSANLLRKQFFRFNFFLCNSFKNSATIVTIKRQQYETHDTLQLQLQQQLLQIIRTTTARSSDAFIQVCTHTLNIYCQKRCVLV